MSFDTFRKKQYIWKILSTENIPRSILYFNKLKYSIEWRKKSVDKILQMYEISLELRYTNKKVRTR